MSDLIDRQAAIDAMEESKKTYFDRRVIIGKMQDIVNNLPSAQPERKTGRITYTHHSEELWGQSAICISCGCKWQIAEECGEDNFCPNCGAYIIGVNTEVRINDNRERGEGRE